MANTEKKMTYVSVLDDVLAGKPITAEMREKLEKMREGYVKKSSANPNAKPTARQEENAALQTIIYNFMQEGVGYHITDLMKSIPELGEMNNQRVSRLVRDMIPGRVERTEVKGRAVFTKIA